jgi:hypothetical protein
VNPGTTAAASQDRVSLGLIIAALFCNVFLAKLAIPGTEGSLSIQLVGLYAILFVGTATGRFRVDIYVFFYFCLLSMTLFLTTIFSPKINVSIGSLLLVLCLLAPYLFAFKNGAVRQESAFKIFGAFALILALCGIMQFVAQFLVGSQIAFWLDYNLPSQFMLQGFHNLISIADDPNSIADGQGIIKSNGIFLLEPSFLSQFVCLAIVIEVVYQKRILVLCTYVVAELVSYSGTGLLILVAVAPILLRHVLWRMGTSAWGILLLIVCAALFFFDELKLGAFLTRLGEFNSNQSSAYARFFSIFQLLKDFVFTDNLATLVGRGPGSITENFTNVDYAAFDPSWGKVLYEYGTIGFLAYFSFFFYCVWRCRVDFAIKAALTVQFMFLGGLVATPEAHMLILALLIWPHGVAEQQETSAESASLA